MKYFFEALVLFAMFLAGCDSSKPSDEKRADRVCTEPENPYTDGTGHYAGYKWAESKGGGDCNGSSSSFNEGCEEYENQESEYQDCEAQEKK